MKAEVLMRCFYQKSLSTAYPIKLWKGSHTKHFSVQCWSYSSGFHWPLQSNSAISTPTGQWVPHYPQAPWLTAVLCNGTVRAARPSADLYLLLSGAHQGQQRKNKPESIPLANKVTAFQTQWNTQRTCAKHEILLITLQPPGQCVPQSTARFPHVP